MGAMEEKCGRQVLRNEVYPRIDFGAMPVTRREE